MEQGVEIQKSCTWIPLVEHPITDCEARGCCGEKFGRRANRQNLFPRRRVVAPSRLIAYQLAMPPKSIRSRKRKLDEEQLSSEKRQEQASTSQAPSLNEHPSQEYQGINYPNATYTSEVVLDAGYDKSELSDSEEFEFSKEERIKRLREDPALLRAFIRNWSSRRLRSFTPAMESELETTLEACTAGTEFGEYHRAHATFIQKINSLLTFRKAPRKERKELMVNLSNEIESFVWNIADHVDENSTKEQVRQAFLCLLDF